MLPLGVNLNPRKPWYSRVWNYELGSIAGLCRDAIALGSQIWRFLCRPFKGWKCNNPACVKCEGGNPLPPVPFANGTYVLTHIRTDKTAETKWIPAVECD
jgi:hypothetical protein